jgi:hypothetical protein
VKIKRKSKINRNQKWAIAAYVVFWRSLARSVAFAQPPSLRDFRGVAGQADGSLIS